MKRTPLIGITASYAPPKENRPVFPDPEFDYLKCEYHEAIAKAGGIPIIIPNLPPENFGLLDELIRKLDGLLLSGGSDLAPKCFGQELNPSAKCVVHPRRDELELDLVRRWFMIRPKGPILAICRGHQVLNAALGGTLIQDFNACGIETIAVGHRTAEAKRTEHEVTVVPGTRLAEIIGEGEHRVNSSHHQGIDRLAEGYIVSARAEDGIIEAIEPEGREGWVISVQWHPEAMQDDLASMKIFKAFIEAAAKA